MRFNILLEKVQIYLRSICFYFNQVKMWFKFIVPSFTWVCMLKSLRYMYLYTERKQNNFPNILIIFMKMDISKTSKSKLFEEIQKDMDI